MPCLRQAAASSLSGSRWNGVASTILKGLAAVWNIAKPSWCFAVMTMYRMPAFLAASTHFSASYLAGLKSLAMAAYSAIGACAPHISHSAQPLTLPPLPFHTPPAWAYSPKWMNMPKSRVAEPGHVPVMLGGVSCRSASTGLSGRVSGAAGSFGPAAWQAITEFPRVAAVRTIVRPSRAWCMVCCLSGMKESGVSYLSIPFAVAP